MRLILFSFLIFGFQASAYIPDYQLIMSRLAENHGRGFYKITQDVVFPASPEPLVVEETWIVSGDDGMSVAFRGKGPLKGKISGVFVYKNGRRYFNKSGIKSSRFSADFLEPIFHFRYSKKMKPKLVAMKIAPAASLQARPLFEGDDSTKFPKQDFVRLSKNGGFVAYAIGDPTPVDSTEENPGIWIEQDRFHVRKVRTISSASVIAANYVRHPRKMWLPKTREYSWDDQSAQVHINSVSPLSKNKTSQELVSTNRFKKDSKDSELEFPELEMIRNFYKRFR